MALPKARFSLLLSFLSGARRSLNLPVAALLAAILSLSLPAALPGEDGSAAPDVPPPLQVSTEDSEEQGSNAAAAASIPSDPVAQPRTGEGGLPSTSSPVVATGADPAPAEDEAPEEDPLAKRIEMLEKLADSLSERMKSISARERALAEREAALESREAALNARETALEARENLVARQEKLPPAKPWNGPPAPTIVGKYAAVIDAQTGQFYHTKDAEKETPVASTQKLLTSLVVIQDGDLDAEVTVQPEDVKVEPTVIGVKAGEIYTRRDLVRALLIRSGNDVAQVLARDNAGSIDAFAGKMNAYAASIGMENSHFRNPHGLPAEGQYSTAHDMALLAFDAYHNPVVREFVQMNNWDFQYASGGTRPLLNTNKVLRSLSDCNGMKTGYTRASGYCLVASGAREDRERIVIVLGSNSSWVWKDTEVLLDWALSY